MVYGQCTRLTFFFRYTNRKKKDMSVRFETRQVCVCVSVCVCVCVHTCVCVCACACVYV